MAQQETRSRNSGQFGMFGEEVDSGAGGALLELDTSLGDLTPQEKAEQEREYLGFAISYDPLRALATVNPGDAINSIDRLDEDMLGGSVTLLGHINGATERYTRDSRKFLRIDLALVGGVVETMVWPDSLGKDGAHLAAGQYGAGNRTPANPGRRLLAGVLRRPGVSPAGRPGGYAGAGVIGGRRR